MCLLDLLPGLLTGSAWKRSGCLVTFCLFNKVVFLCWWNARCRLQRSPVSRTAALYTGRALVLLQPSSVLLSPSCLPHVSPPLYSISITAAAARLKCHLTVWEDKDYDGFQMKGNFKQTEYWSSLLSWAPHVPTRKLSDKAGDKDYIFGSYRGIKFNQHLFRSLWWWACICQFLVKIDNICLFIISISPPHLQT